MKTSDLVNATAQVPDVGAMSGPAAVAFGMEVGQISGPFQGGSSSGIVLAVIEKQQPSPEEAKAALGQRQGNAARPEAPGPRRPLRAEPSRQAGEGRQDQDQQERDGAHEPRRPKDPRAAAIPDVRPAVQIAGHLFSTGE